MTTMPQLMATSLTEERASIQMLNQAWADSKSLSLGRRRTAVAA